MNTSTPKPETGRITLSMTVRTIKDLRLLAILRGSNKNAIAEEYLFRGGLQGDVDRLLHLSGAHTPHGISSAEVDEGTNAPLPTPPAPPCGKPLRICPDACPAPSGERLVGGNDDDIPW